MNPSDFWLGACWVIGIIAVLVFLFLPAYGGCNYPKKNAAVADLSTIRTQLEVFKIDNSRYPTTAEGFNILVTNLGNMPTWTHAYLDKFPLDPWQHPYIYRQPGPKGQPFNVFSCGPDGIAGNADDIHYPLH